MVSPSRLSTPVDLDVPAAAAVPAVIPTRAERRRTSDRRSTGERLFAVVNIVALGVIAGLSLYPFVFTLSMSLSSAAEANRQSLHLFPTHTSLAAYRVVLGDADMLRAMFNSVCRTALGTVLTLLATCLVAYPLSRPQFPHRGLVLFLIVFTMVFGGGIVPNYLLVRNLGLLNTVWALVLPTMLVAFNVVIVKNFFQQIPASFHEAARVEGANEWLILFKIYVPLSAPILATVGLWTAVGHWNQWFDATLYITDDHRQVLQVFLQRVVLENNTRLLDGPGQARNAGQFTPETVKAATVMLTVLPMLLVLPFVQRFFAKGMLIGGVKE